MWRHGGDAAMRRCVQLSCAVMLPVPAFRVPPHRCREGKEYCIFHLPKVNVVRCEGRKQNGEQCRVSSDMPFENAETLRAGSRYCAIHKNFRRSHVSRYDDASEQELYGKPDWWDDAPFGSPGGRSYSSAAVAASAPAGGHYSANRAQAAYNPQPVVPAAARVLWPAENQLPPGGSLSQSEVVRRATII
jgi:hypothetical protein